MTAHCIVKKSNLVQHPLTMDIMNFEFFSNFIKWYHRCYLFGDFDENLSPIFLKIEEEWAIKNWA